MNASEVYVGLMSGTSLDGVDAVVVDLSANAPQLRGTHFLPFPAPLKQALIDLHTPGSDELARAAELSNELSRLYAQAVKALLDAAGIAPAQVRAIGCHGQTVRHRPERGYTIQLGNSALLAELTGIAVVADFRSRDIAAGGEGAPLVPAFHAAVFAHPGRHRAIVNIGGIANLTDLPARGAVTGFDTGPGNVLLDAWTQRHTGHDFDRDGAWAASGEAIPDLLDAMLGDAYFKRAAPKSTGRDHFNPAWIESFQPSRHRPEDVQATLTELTARSIADAVHISGAQEVWLCGGGAHNRALAGRIAALLPQCATDNTARLGLDPDWVEAAAFAWLAKQAIEGRPGNLPAVTGAKAARVLGAIYPA